MKSIGQKIKQIDGLRGTSDVNDWEEEFITSIVERTQCGERTSHLTEKQVESIERIYRKHFA